MSTRTDEQATETEEQNTKRGRGGGVEGGRGLHVIVWRFLHATGQYYQYLQRSCMTVVSVMTHLENMPMHISQLAHAREVDPMHVILERRVPGQFESNGRENER